MIDSVSSGLALDGFTINVETVDVSSDFALFVALVHEDNKRSLSMVSSPASAVSAASASMSTPQLKKGGKASAKAAPKAGSSSSSSSSSSSGAKRSRVMSHVDDDNAMDL